MKILDATPAKLLELFWKANPKTINGTLLDFISNNNFGLIADGCFYSVSEVMKLSDEVPHFVERFSLERKYSGAINIEGNLAIHDYIDCSVRDFVSKVFHKVGGVLRPEEVEANRDGPNWLSRFIADPNTYLVIEGDCSAITIKCEPISS